MNHDICGRQCLAPRETPNNLSHPALETMTNHRRTHLPAGCGSEPGPGPTVGVDIERRARSIPPPSAAIATDEVLPLAEPITRPPALARRRGGQTQRRLRPLRRRRASTARPCAVFIRLRKPCFFLRRRLLGWNVRFTVIDLLSEHRAPDHGLRTTPTPRCRGLLFSCFSHRANAGAYTHEPTRLHRAQPMRTADRRSYDTRSGPVKETRSKPRPPWGSARGLLVLGPKPPCSRRAASQPGRPTRSHPPVQAGVYLRCPATAIRCPGSSPTGLCLASPKTTISPHARVPAHTRPGRPIFNTGARLLVAAFAAIAERVANSRGAHPLSVVAMPLTAHPRQDTRPWQWAGEP